MKIRHLDMVVSFLLATGLTACGGGGGSLPSVGALNTQRVTTTSASLRSSTALNGASYTAIDAGGPAAGSWIADSDFNGGGTYSVPNAINTSRVSSPAPQSVYQTLRYARSLVYTIPHLTPNGSYNVRLHFAETYFTAPGKRIFNIKINGRSVLTNFDTFAQAGGENIAIIQAFTANADASGVMTVELDATVNNAAIGGIEVISLTNPPVVAPGIAINLGGTGTGSWVADRDYTGGWVATVAGSINTSGVSNAPPQSVYQSQRVGTSFTYVVPSLTPNSLYNVRLHFVESFFSSAGQRLFNVTVNGAQGLTAFDIFKNAGGQNVAIAKLFSAESDAAGRITIAFTATVNNASVAGIEVLDPTTSGSPTPTPSSAPTTTPTSIPTATPAPVSGGVAWPAPGWVPYSKSPLTVPVAPNPTFTAGSASMISAMWAGQPTNPGRFEVSSGPPPPDSRDFSQPLYFGRASDPQYKVSCYDYGGGCSASGAIVHIPKGAYPAGGSDHHIAIRDLVTGKDVMLWLAPIPTGNGGNYSVGWGAVVPSDGDGLNAIGASASGMSALWALRETDLAHNTINHALVVGVNHESGDGYVYPAVGWDNGYFRSDPWPKMGAHFWLDVAPPYAADCPQYAVSYLTALHKYGAFFADQGDISSPMEASLESDYDYTYNGGASVWGPLMKSLGGSSVGHSNVPMSDCGINMQTHMHVLNPPAQV